jgi:hypothetical protein
MGQVVRVFPLQFGRHRVIVWEREGDEWELFVRGRSGILHRRSITAKVAASLLNPAAVDPQPIPRAPRWTWLERGAPAKLNEERPCST